MKWTYAKFCIIKAQSQILVGVLLSVTDIKFIPCLKRVQCPALTLQIFSGDKYWRFDDAVGRVELDYPRDISMWRGVPSDVDAAFQYIDGKTYFFKVGLPESGCGV